MGEPGYVGADLDDFAGELVTYRHTRSGERVLAGGYVQIRAAQPRSLDPNLQLASARRRHLPVYEVYIPPAVPDDARARPSAVLYLWCLIRGHVSTSFWREVTPAGVTPRTPT